MLDPGWEIGYGCIPKIASSNTSFGATGRFKMGRTGVPVLPHLARVGAELRDWGFFQAKMTKFLRIRVSTVGFYSSLYSQLKSNTSNDVVALYK